MHIVCLILKIFLSIIDVIIVSDLALLSIKELSLLLHMILLFTCLPGVL